MHILQGVPGRAAALFCAGAVGSFATSVCGQLVVDGGFDDWAGISPIATDPAGDATGVFDLTAVSVTSRGTMLYLRFDTGAVVNLQSGPREDGTLVLRVSAGADRSVAINMRARTYVARPPEAVEGWSAIDYHAAPTYAANAFEVALDAAGIGATVGDELAITFAGSDTLATPVAWRLSSPAVPASVRSPDRARRRTCAS